MGANISIRPHNPKKGISISTSAPNYFWEQIEAGLQSYGNNCYILTTKDLTWINAFMYLDKNNNTDWNKIVELIQEVNEIEIWKEY